MKRIFITVASTGTGKATAILFTPKGWFVGASDVNAAGLEEIKNCAGGKIGNTAPLDVMDTEMSSAVLKEFNTTAG